ncbi:Vacuolar protein-sorting-associated protein 28 [Neophaeococcomyces mojaviensis]|uniref:Vacuolar protein-sorting-associated protein 28 n=1 Tax=Neophaeococcomyces mojaviensis TaxID=3383035 RepID=A0ACC3AGF6_9EURO|nr:Vacuolar protein-sorting-associated protein 28 [Knufia sp. JES_112]
MYSPQPGAGQPAYAPTPHHYVPNPSFTARVSVDEEMRLADSAAQRDLIDSLAEIYSIIRTLDGLEKAYQKDALPEQEYSDMCSKMLRQYQSILSDKNVQREFGDLDSFMKEWDIECPRAAETLRTGVIRPELYVSPAPVVPSSSVAGPSGSLVMAATENFITFLDALKLNYVTKSTLHPILSDVIQSVNKVTDKDFEHRGKIIQWLITLNQMRTTEELSDEQAGDLAFDMEQAYNGFKSMIASGV